MSDDVQAIIFVTGAGHYRVLERAVWSQKEIQPELESKCHQCVEVVARFPAYFCTG